MGTRSGPKRLTANARQQTPSVSPDGRPSLLLAIARPSAIWKIKLTATPNGSQIVKEKRVILVSGRALVYYTSIVLLQEVPYGGFRVRAVLLSDYRQILPESVVSPDGKLIACCSETKFTPENRYSTCSRWHTSKAASYIPMAETLMFTACPPGGPAMEIIWSMSRTAMVSNLWSRPLDGSHPKADDFQADSYSLCLVADGTRSPWLVASASDAILISSAQ